ncbi:MAG: 5-deoxy-glucuronate isomerase [Bacteroidales bacterium]|nr:5-deoxy-glucuronate isomerase [Bacteroidales bacterium]
MFSHIREFSHGESIIPSNDSLLPDTYFNIIKLKRGETYSLKLPDYETVWVVLQGNSDAFVDGKQYANIGQRKDVWSGKADSVYAGAGAEVMIIGNNEITEIAIVGGKCSQKYPSFRIKPEEVEMVEVGSSETKSHRKIFHILGQNGAGCAGNLLVSELYCEEGCWSGYPPHKHDSENPPEETAFEETYHYRFNPDTGFGAQFLYDDHGNSHVVMTRHGDTFAFKGGYHPTVTSPGHAEYILTILVGKHHRSLIQNFKEEHRYLMEKIPGIAGMREKFK